MLTVRATNKFEKEYAKAVKAGKDITKLDEIILKLAQGKKLENRHFDHPLKGPCQGHRECHIEPDWLLIYKKCKKEIIFERTGSHSELFR
jgi:mRNA interferase YafQ